MFNRLNVFNLFVVLSIILIPFSNKSQHMDLIVALGIYKYLQYLAAYSIHWLTNQTHSFGRYCTGNSCQVHAQEPGQHDTVSGMQGEVFVVRVHT